MKVFKIWPFYFLFYSLFVSFDLFADGPIPVIKIKKRPHQVIKDYLVIHHQYQKNLCAPGEEEKFNKLFKNYKGAGYYVPVLKNNTLDKETIKKNIPELKAKRAWIDSILSYVENQKNFNAFILQTKALESKLKTLVDFKESYFETKDEVKRNNFVKQTAGALDELEEQFSDLTKAIPFMLGYHFPADHLALRKEYDKLKAINSDKANSVYFYRKIVEDGAMNSDTSRPDMFLRTTLNTIALKLRERPELIDENLRFDLFAALKSIGQHLKNGKNSQMERLKEWQARTERAITFYQSLLNNKVWIDGKFESGKEYLESQSKARYQLKQFVKKKQWQSYQFWSKQPELYQALFSIETILFNEVGSIDGRDALERKDVTQVVINRRFNPKYNQMNAKDSFFESAPPEINLDFTKEHPWNNILFKEGEFSFTYFFIPSTVRLFCPEVTTRGKFLQRENLKIAINALVKPNYQFKALRYFSRSAMVGRIDMASIWKQYSAMDEMPGPKSQRSRKLYNLYKKGQYTYWYHFAKSQNQWLKVIEINNAPYVFSNPDKVFYKYRNPHVFRYFTAL